MLFLPRGSFQGNQDVSLSTAAWETPQGVERLAYVGGPALFLGAIPYSETWPLLAEINTRINGVAAHIEAPDPASNRARFPPATRAAIVKDLDAIWQAAQTADCLPLGVDDDRHFVTIAGARSGKGRSAIIPNLCLYPGSVVVLDPKGENASLTAARRGQGDAWAQGLGQAVYVLDPFGVAKVPDELRASLNPLALLDPASPLVVDDAALLAEGLIPPGDRSDDHWTETARNIVKGIVLHLISTRQNATLFDLRRALTIGDKPGFAEAVRRRKEAEAELKQAQADDPDFERDLDEEGLLPAGVRDAFAFLLWSMTTNAAFNGVVQGAAESILGTGENERGSTLSTARRNTAFLDTLGENFQDALDGSRRPFDPELLKAAPEGVSVYLCLPSERMGTHGRWLRLMIGVFLERMQRNLRAPASGAPVLFLLEEFFTLGPMTAIEKAVGYAAGFGVKLWAILQDLQQLMSLYPSSWQTFLANAGAVQIFGASDRATLEYASKALGDIELVLTNTQVNEQQSGGTNQPSVQQRYGSLLAGLGGGSGQQRYGQLQIGQLLLSALDANSVSDSSSRATSMSTSRQAVPLLRPEELAMQFARETGAALLLLKGRLPVWCLRTDYDSSPWFQGLYTPLEDRRDEVARGQRPRGFDQRSPEAMREALQALAQLERETGLSA